VSAQVTHRGSVQVVSAAELRRMLRASGEGCYCAPDPGIEWDAGECPRHPLAARQVAERPARERLSEVAP